MNSIRFCSTLAGLCFFFAHCTAVAAEQSSRTFLQPLGEIAQGQQQHLGWVLLLMAIAVIPVFVATPWIYLRYRYGKNNAYQPNWTYNRLLEYALWGVPALIVVALSYRLWTATHDDDPYRALPGNETPLCVEVIGLNWQWLFIYPQYNTASLNHLVIPTDRAISLRLTSDTVMQSFRISALAGQIYAMPGMQTKLHFSAFQPGSAWGENTQFNGDGFAKQHFLVDAMAADEFETWQQQTQAAMPALSENNYADLGQRQPAVTNGNVNISLYSAYPASLFDRVIQRYHSGKSLAHEAQPGSPSYRPDMASLPSAAGIEQSEQCSVIPTKTEEQDSE